MGAAVAEGRRAVERLGMPALNMLTNVRGRGLNDRSLEPIFALAQELDVPVTFHAGGGRFVEDRMDCYAMSHTCAFPFDIMYGLTCALCGGLMERFPRLRVAFLEAGCGFFPYYLQRLDEHFEKRRGEMPARRRPSEVVAEGRVLVSCEPDEKALAWVVDSVGADKILYASDYPHWDCEFPDSVRRIRERPELSESAKNAILGDNAARFFGL
jgi:predicted TIM-barrel fold metal-dependent hydrolase